MDNSWFIVCDQFMRVLNNKEVNIVNKYFKQTYYNISLYYGQ